jgi:shikimate 5-dehydrogenase
LFLLFVCNKRITNVVLLFSFEIQVAKDNLGALDDFFSFVQNRKDIPAVNITQPHKSSPVLRELYLGDANNEANVDTLIRNDEGKLEPYDLNSTAFVEWYKGKVGPFSNRPVVLVGAGGVGEPIAKKIAAEKPSNLLLVNVADKSNFAASLGETTQAPTSFASSLEGILESGLPAGKEGAENESELWELIQKMA